MKIAAPIFDDQNFLLSLHIKGLITFTFANLSANDIALYENIVHQKK
jgi:hypothetical protein